MSRPELPPELRRYIVSNIPSVPYLEGILLMRAEPERAWSTQEMARRLYVSESDSAPLLESAVANGVAVAAEGAERAYRYQPVSPELAALLDRLAAHYAADVVTVATLIHGKGDKRAQQFADAFRWRKDS
ncbi:hypothetical protein EZ242_18590 [Ramlibacter rhizophilus]|uniref:MarR family transcriptional regulator n=1 Tax=Ramlibacter rhizophilus TaxID=1781167 RepID=A0A4Z0BDY9_9BURK|nr:hypothetical protein EZ242_18590 [Ramlibacter rhizophilus]